MRFLWMQARATSKEWVKKNTPEADTSQMHPGSGDMDDPQAICRLNTHLERLPNYEAAKFEEEFYREVGENLDQTVEQTLNDMGVPRYKAQCG